MAVDRVTEPSTAPSTTPARVQPPPVRPPDWVGRIGGAQAAVAAERAARPPVPAKPEEEPIPKVVRRQFEESEIFTSEELARAGLKETPKTWEAEGYQRWYYDTPEGRQQILQDIARSRASRGLPIDYGKIPEVGAEQFDLERLKRLKPEDSKPIRGALGISARQYERLTGKKYGIPRPPKSAEIFDISDREDELKSAQKFAEQVASGEAQLPPEIDSTQYWDSVQDIGKKLSLLEQAKAVLAGTLTVRDPKAYKRWITLATSPFAVLTDEGASVDIYSAIKAGVPDKVLRSWGFSQVTIAGTKRDIRFRERQREVETGVRQIEAERRLETGKQRQLSLVEFEAWVNTEAPAELRAAYRSGGVEGYNVALVQQRQERAQALTTLEPYRAYLDRYSIVDALLSDDPKVIEAVRVVYGEEEITKARRWMEKNWELQEQYFLGETKYPMPWVTTLKGWYRGATPWDEERGETFIQSIRDRVSKLPVPASLTSVLSATGLVAVAEPTPIGEVVFALLAAGAIATAYIGSQEVSSVGELQEAVKQFRSDYRRELTPQDVVLVAPTGTEAITLATAMPFTVTEPFPTGEQLIPPPVEPFVGTQLRPSTLTPYTGTSLVPPALVQPKIALVPPRVDIPQEQIVPSTPPISRLMVASAAVADAETAIRGVLIRPKIWTIAEMDRFLPATIPTTSKSLVVLDKAVTEAAQEGRITDEDVAAYRKARSQFLSKKKLLNAALRSYIGGVSPNLSSSQLDEAVVSLAALLTQLPGITEAGQQAAIDAYNQAVRAQVVTEEALAQSQTAADTATRTAIRSMTSNIARPAVRTAVQTALQTMTQTATQTAVSQAVRAAPRTAARVPPRTAEMAKAAELTATLAPPVPPVPSPPKFPRLPRGAVGKGVRAIAPGSIVWKQGWCWYYIPSPYNQAKPMALGRIPPSGADITGRTPLETLQIIGRAGARVPKLVSLDLGFADIFIRRGREIEFKGAGLETDVGLGDPSPTVGMSTFDGGGVIRPEVRRRIPLERGERIEGGLREMRDEERIVRPEVDLEPELEEGEEVEYEVVPEGYEAVPEPAEESPGDVNDLFTVSREDLWGKPDGNSTDSGDFTSLTMLSDEDEQELLDVSSKDIMGEAPQPPQPKRVVRRIRRTSRPYQPPSSLGGVRY